MSQLVDIKVIVGGLAARIQALASELLPGGMKDGHEWRCGSVAGEAGQSMAVHLVGDKAGVWADFSTGETGDALDLVAAVLFRGDKKQALVWARRWLGLDTRDPRELATQRRNIERAQAAAAKRCADDEERRRRQAFRIWLSSRESIEGTPAHAYLEGRGIDFAELGRFPRSLRFAADLFHREGQRFPAMVAAIIGADGRFVAAHRTYLARRADGSWGKAPVKDAKVTLGRYVGGFIRLWRPIIDGKPGKPLNEAPEGSHAFLCEGIEDGLTIAMARPDSYVVVAVSLANMARVKLPRAIASITVVADNDTKPEAVAAFDRAVDALVADRREVDISRPPAGFKDVNDLLVRYAHANTQDGAA
jgi:hypothetical protein